MIEFAWIEANKPFAAAIGLMFGLGLVEALTAICGFSASRLIDSLLPASLGDTDDDADADSDTDLDVDGDIAGPDAAGGAGVMVGVLAWLSIGRVPVLALVAIFLTIFGLAGLVLQGAATALFGSSLPSSLSSLLAFAVAVPGVRVCGLGLAQVISTVETSTVSSENFVGRVATLTAGAARADRPARARLVDHHGEAHYVMIEPDDHEVEFETGDKVLIISRDGTLYRAIRAARSALRDI